MADNVVVTPGSGKTVLADEVVDGTLGTGVAQFVKLMDGTLDSSNKAVVSASGALKVDPSGVTSPVSLASVPSHNVTNAGTFAVQAAATLAAETTKVIGTVNIAASQTVAAVTAITNALPAGTNLLGKTDIQIAGSAPDVGSGTGGSKTQRVIMDSSQLSSLGQTTMSASAPVVFASDQSPIGSIPKPTATANGQTSSRVAAAASTNATSLKASAGQVGEVDLYNVAAYTVFLKFYNKASAPTVGTDTPVWTIPIQAGGGYAKSFPRGKTFATGIAYAITKLQADSDTTAVAAGDVTGSIDWI
jgi:hypothetical protein